MASALLWGGMFLLVAVLNQITGGYGAHLLDFGASIYPGYEMGAGFGSMVVLTLYALVDGAIAGAVLAGCTIGLRRRRREGVVYPGLVLVQDPLHFAWLASVRGTTHPARPDGAPSGRGGIGPECAHIQAAVRPGTRSVTSLVDGDHPRDRVLAQEACR
ncbi:MAG: hypothetical protein R3324_16070 [Halobacteriales archaeon]|nr:hypothetical protein [Halobacteriales archaeon]